MKSLERTTDAALTRIERAQEAGIANGTDVRLLVSYVGRFRGAVEDFEAREADLRADPNISESARAERLSEAFQAAEREVSDVVSRIDSTVTDRIKKAQRRATPRGVGEPTEAQLANARSDARMVLDPATEDQIAPRLANLAETGDDAMRHLILATPWPERYIASRDSDRAGAVWANRRHALLPLVLDDDGMAALQALEAGGKHLRAVVQLVNAGAHMWRQAAGMRTNAGMQMNVTRGAA